MITCLGVEGEMREMNREMERDPLSRCGYALSGFDFMWRMKFF